MAKTQKPQKPTAPKTEKAKQTAERKGKKVLKSNGLPFFKKWATETFTGGRRRKGGRGSLSTVSPNVFNQLLRKGENSSRKMDNPNVQEN